MNLIDPREYVAQRLANIQPRFVWDAEAVKTTQDPLAYQATFRAALDTTLASVLSWERVELDIESVGKEQLDGYTREAITFGTRPGLRAFAYLLVPDGLTEPSPAIVALPGHGVGVDGVVGMQDEPYHAAFAVQCVKRGYVTLALEQFSFGRRRDEQAHRQGGGASSCVRDSMAALMLGECMTGWRVFDAMRAIDVLCSRPDVHPKRITTMGISGGGLTSLFTAALDTRIMACMVSGYFNTFRDSILGVDHCVDNYIPGMSQLCEMPTLAALIAPRPFFVEGGTQDTIFPLHALEQAIAHATTIYEDFAAADQFDHEIFEGGHVFHGDKAFAFLRERMVL
jgi:dienelactone hydrolase